MTQTYYKTHGFRTKKTKLYLNPRVDHHTLSQNCHTVYIWCEFPIFPKIPELIKSPHLGLSENSVTLNPMVLLIIIPFLNGYFIGNINPTFSDKPIFPTHKRHVSMARPAPPGPGRSWRPTRRPWRTSGPLGGPWPSNLAISPWPCRWRSDGGPETMGKMGEKALNNGEKHGVFPHFPPFFPWFHI